MRFTWTIFAILETTISASTLTSEELEFSLGSGSERRVEPDEIVPLHAAEKAYVEKALYANKWNITQTARALEISPTTLRKKIADYGLTR